MNPYILLMLMWTPSMHTGGSVNGVEFADRPSCEAAAQAAKKKFEGWGTEFYWVCAPKDASRP